MTPEGVIMIIILCFACLKIFQDKFYNLRIVSVNVLTTSKFAAESIVYFILSTIAGLVITNQIIGLILLNAIAWVAYHVFLKSLGYNIISWISLVIYSLFAHATYVTFDPVPFSEIWYYTLFSWEIALLFVLLYDTLGKYIKILSSLITWLTTIAVISLPFIFIIYKLSFNVPMEGGQLNAIYQTDYSEAFRFVQNYIPPFYLVAFLIAIAGLLIVLIAQEFRLKKNIEKRVFFQMVLGLLILANLNVLENLLMPKLLINSAMEYANELERFKKELKKRKSGDIKFTASKENEKEIYVVIIGESLNKNHMSLYGYHRKTTPQLDQLYQDGELLKFDEAFSNHVHTIPVLLQSLTLSNQQNNKKAHLSLSILDIMEKADFDTYWLSNQVAFGVWDNPVSVLAERADHRINFNSNVGKITSTMFLDEHLATKLEEIVSEDISQNTAIFVHLMGNHSDYKNRYSEDFEIYKGELNKKYFGKNKFVKRFINTYDNSILYNDYVVSKIIKALQKNGGISTCLYFADHSEDVLANLGHNVGLFTFPMTEAPMILWASDGYKVKYQEKYEILKSRSQQLFSNDLISETLIGIADISTDQYISEFDLSSEYFHLPLEKCFTLHGERKYAEKENLNFNQKRNIAVLDSLNSLSRVFPHRVNTVGKLKKIVYNGSNSFEVDVIFRQGETRDSFEVGHDEQAMSGMSLEELLSSVGENQIRKIWLDIKNLNEENLSAILKRLNSLDQKFNFKEKVIVESDITSPLFANISNSGFHTSYYMPTGIKNMNQKDFPEKAKKMAQQIQNQQVVAISFEVSLYPFVKEHLEKLIPETIVYHTWDLDLQLKYPEFKEELIRREYFMDTRIESVLVGYLSDFEL